jgi:hypothetical protein
VEEQDLIDELQAFTTTAPKFTPRQLTNINNRWLVRSAFQKAIRRGQVDAALRYGEYMFYHQDLTYPWSALATVIIEDVGFGDLDLVAYSTVTNLKGVRDYMEEELLFAAMIQRACQAEKSRSCCELDLGLAMRCGDYDKKTQSYPGVLGLSYKEAEARTEAHLIYELQQTVGTNIYHLEEDHVRARVLRQKYRHRPVSDLIPALTMIRDSFPEAPATQRACMFSFERTVDTMNVALFPIMKWLSLAGADIVDVNEKPTWPESVEIVSVASEAFDMHERRGKMALKAFWKRLVEANTHPWFKEIGDSKAVRGVGALVFICEGGLVDRRLLNEDLLHLRFYQDFNFAAGYSGKPIPAEDFQLCLHAVKERIPILNELRKWAVDQSS